MKFGNVLVNFCNWMWRFMILNFLWVIGTLLGLIVFGIMPSTVAMFYILRKWIQGNLEIPLITTFINIYKEEFIRSNKCGLPFFILFLFLSFDLIILYNMQESYSLILYILVMTVLFFVSISFMFFFPTYVHFKYTNKEYVKNSFIIALTSPMQTGLIFVGFLILSYIVKGRLGFAAFFFISIPSYLVMHVCYKKFLQLQKNV